jgi:hypothetical protein
VMGTCRATGATQPPSWGGPHEAAPHEAAPHEAAPHEASPHEAAPHEATPHEATCHLLIAVFRLAMKGPREAGSSRGDLFRRA